MQTQAIGTPTSFGHMLKQWRQSRGQSQLDLALKADVSQRHISFMETGRARPREDMVHRLTEALDLPLRDRNDMYLAAGLPAMYPDVPLDDPFAEPFRRALSQMLAMHDPYPAYVVDRYWNLMEANKMGTMMFPEATNITENAAKDTPVNIVDAFFAPGPYRDMVENFPDVAAVFHQRLKNEVLNAPHDQGMSALLMRLDEYLKDVPPPSEAVGSDLIICPRLNVGGQTIQTVTMIAQFGHTRAANIDEMRVELVYPADEAAEQFFAMMAGGIKP